jgi:hypothetical protein
MTQLHTTFGLISSQIISVTSARFSPIITIILSQIIVKRNTIHQPTSDPADKYDLEEVLEKLDFAVITARNALDRAAIPGESQN